MYYLLTFIYKISFTINEKPRFYATFSLPSDKNNLIPFEGDSVEDLAGCIRKHVEGLKMSFFYFEADFLLERKYSNKGGSIKYTSPFTESEEKTFLLLLSREV
jgi:hypothetical protein